MIDVGSVDACMRTSAWSDLLISIASGTSTSSYSSMHVGGAMIGQWPAPTWRNPAVGPTCMSQLLASILCKACIIAVALHMLQEQIAASQQSREREIWILERQPQCTGAGIQQIKLRRCRCMVMDGLNIDHAVLQYAREREGHCRAEVSGSDEDDICCQLVILGSNNGSVCMVIGQGSPTWSSDRFDRRCMCCCMILDCGYTLHRGD